MTFASFSQFQRGYSRNQGIFRKSGDIQEINGEDDAQTEGRLASVTLGVLVLILLLPLNALCLPLVYEGYRLFIRDTACL
jgi:hypothetical protein